MIKKDYTGILILGIFISIFYYLGLYHEYAMALGPFHLPLLLGLFSFIIWSITKTSEHSFFILLWKGVKISFMALMLSILLLIISCLFRGNIETGVNEVLMALPKIISNTLMNGVALISTSILLAIVLYFFQKRDKESQTLDDHLLGK